MAHNASPVSSLATIRMKQLPSGTRTSPAWPIGVLNAAGRLLQQMGWAPKVADQTSFAALGRDDTWTGPLSDWVREARDVRTRAYDTDARLTPFGTLAIRSQILHSYRNMIGFERLIARNPQILDEPIEKPVFVIGWPRTGTTVMQRLLCQHRDALYTTVWEGYEPLPCDGAAAIPAAKRRAKAQRALRLLRFISPQLSTIHPMDADDPDECYHLFRNYSAMPPGWDFAHLPSYWNWFDTTAAHNAYKVHKRQLQVLQWYRRKQSNRKGHWVLKSPQHMAGLPALLQIYPDARIVFTQRNPVEAVASYCSLLAVAWGVTCDDVEPQKIAEYVLDAAVRSHAIAHTVMEKLPARQVARVDYGELMRDTAGTAARASQHLGYPDDPQMKSKMEAWLTANPKGRNGQHIYRLSDFGLTEEGVRQVLQIGQPVADTPAWTAAADGTNRKREHF